MAPINSALDEKQIMFDAKIILVFLSSLSKRALLRVREDSARRKWNAMNNLAIGYRLLASGLAAYLPTISINLRAFSGARLLTSLLK
jgi:hypothetical protein